MVALQELNSRTAEGFALIRYLQDVPAEFLRSSLSEYEQLKINVRQA